MSKKPHPWRRFNKVLGRNPKRKLGDLEAIYTHQVVPKEPTAPTEQPK